MATKRKATATEEKALKTAEAKEEKKLYGTVIGGRKLNIRSSKTTDEDNVVGTLDDGQKVEILKDGKLWCRIEQGYVMRQYLNIE